MRRSGSQVLSSGNAIKSPRDTDIDRRGLGARSLPADYFLATRKDVSVDFGGGVSLSHLNDAFLKCEVGTKLVKHHPSELHYYEFPQQNFKEGEPAPLVTLSGFVNNRKPARIRGEVSFQFNFTDFTFPQVLPNADLFSDLVPKVGNELSENGLVFFIATSTERGAWKGVALESSPVRGMVFRPVTSKVMRNGMHHWAVEAEVPAGSKVKLFFAANWGSLKPVNDGARADGNTLRLYDARLFGAECYPDFSANDKCLGD